MRTDQVNSSDRWLSRAELLSISGDGGGVIMDEEGESRVQSLYRVVAWDRSLFKRGRGDIVPTDHIRVTTVSLLVN